MANSGAGVAGSILPHTLAIKSGGEKKKEGRAAGERQGRQFSVCQKKERKKEML